MSHLLKPCLVCGTLTKTPRCTDHETQSDRAPKTSPRKRGYDTAWDKLSKRARRLQPFCEDCGTTTDLQADHSPQAWERKNQGLPIRLEDVSVVCGPCNIRRGPARQTEGGGQGPERDLRTPGGRHNFSYTPGGILGGIR